MKPITRKAAQVTASLFSTFAIGACPAEERLVPAGWKTDCVGRMQLSLSGGADLPFTPLKRIESSFSITQPRDSLPFEFADGASGGHTDLHYRGRLMLSGPLSSEKLDVLIAAHRTSARTQALKSFGSRVAPSDAKYTMQPIPLQIGNASAWQFYGSQFDLAVRYGNHLLSGTFDTSTIDLNQSSKVLVAFARSIQPRALFEVPTETGVCIPYTFIRDDGHTGRSIGVTYRLQDHPDVTIWLEDSTAHAPTPEQDLSKFTAQYRTEFFWSQNYQSRKAWRWLSKKSVNDLMDGRKGVASVVELKRDDDTIDYGYLAVVRGDPDAKQDTPDLQFYVIRDAKNAIAKGKQPIDKDELIKLAQSIAASVKRRPVQ